MKNTKNKKKPYSEMTFKELKVLAEKGDAEAQFKLGCQYSNDKKIR